VIATAEKRAADAGQKNQRISEFRDEVVEYRQKKREWIDRLPSWEYQRKSAGDRQNVEQLAHSQLRERHQRTMKRFDERREKLNEATAALDRNKVRPNTLAGIPVFCKSGASLIAMTSLRLPFTALGPLATIFFPRRALINIERRLARKPITRAEFPEPLRFGDPRPQSPWILADSRALRLVPFCRR
jgi:hypothetical protein